MIIICKRGNTGGKDTYAPRVGKRGLSKVTILEKYSLVYYYGYYYYN